MDPDLLVPMAQRSTAVEQPWCAPGTRAETVAWEANLSARPERTWEASGRVSVGPTAGASVALGGAGKVLGRTKKTGTGPFSQQQAAKDAGLSERLGGPRPSAAHAHFSVVRGGAEERLRRPLHLARRGLKLLVYTGLGWALSQSLSQNGLQNGVTWHGQNVSHWSVFARQCACSR